MRVSCGIVKREAEDSMNIRVLLLIMTLAAAAWPCAREQKQESECTPLFIKATFYPTCSLSRYDYNIDINRRELRAYIELRRGGIQGEPVRDARVQVNGNAIEYNETENDYRRRILLENAPDFPRDITIEIKRSDGCRIRESFTFPGWVEMASPQPQIITADKDIAVNWTFSSLPFPLQLHIYDYSQRRSLLHKRLEPSQATLLPRESIPAGAVLRIWITADWFFKKYLSGKDVVRGSEINVMPWSQVFVRTRSRETGP